MAVCTNCGHMAPLPVRELISRYGELCAVEMALIHLRCEECQQSKVEAPAHSSVRARLPEVEVGGLTARSRSLSWRYLPTCSAISVG